MPCKNFFFENHTRISNSAYKATKIGHDLRLGYSILSKSATNIYKEMPAYPLLPHLSYCLPGISLISSLINKEIEFDKSALLWTVVNGLQSYLFNLNHSTALILGAYTLDIYLAYLNDKNYFQTKLKSEKNADIPFLEKYLESLFSSIFLGIVTANLYHYPDIGLLFFGISLIFKYFLLTRNQSNHSPCHYSPYALMNCIAPVALLFSVKSEYNLIFGISTLSMTLYLLRNSEEIETIKMIEKGKKNQLAQICIELLENGHKFQTEEIEGNCLN